MNQKLKEWLITKGKVAADVSDEEFEKALKTAMESGELSDEEYAKMANETPDHKKELTEIVGGAVAAANAPVVEALKSLSEAVVAAVAPKSPEDAGDGKEEPDDDKAKSDVVDVDAIVERVKAEIGESVQGNGFESGEVIARAATHIRVKEASERYSHTKTALICPEMATHNMKHPRAGEQALDHNTTGRALDVLTERDYARIGAYLKFISPLGYRGKLSRMPEHERNLVLDTIHKELWSGDVGWRSETSPGIHKRYERLTEREMKSILDDATSGGSYAVPQILEDAVIITPILFGELFPLVEVIPVNQGSQVDGFKLTDVSISSGHGSGNVEGTAMSLASTAGLISNFDTSIFACTAGVEWGRDWESDAVVDFGRLMTERLGEKLKEWLDNQIANGDGTTEPTGIFTESGILSVASANGTSGPYTIGDMEDLAWKVTKAYRASKGGNRNAFIGSDTAYKRVRSVPITTSDDRRIFGSNYQDYEVLSYPFRVQDDISNGRIAFGNLAWYRMFRRLGIRFESSSEGETLLRKNTQLLIMRARYGGRPTQGGAFAKMTDGAQTG